ncbi:hypothetical protein ABH944_001432 [Caballeronia udeis]|uniref:Secreted protein n=1 Tax=Caballeronia udeis TaxID=1232866 RepID=A0ABW8MF63_9BURK
MASVAAFVFVQICTAMGLEDSLIWNGFLRDVTRRRPPVQRAVFRGKLSWSTRLFQHLSRLSNPMLPSGGISAG